MEKELIKTNKNVNLECEQNSGVIELPTGWSNNMVLNKVNTDSGVKAAAMNIYKKSGDKRSFSDWLNSTLTTEQGKELVNTLAQASSGGIVPISGAGANQTLPENQNPQEYKIIGMNVITFAVVATLVVLAGLSIWYFVSRSQAKKKAAKASASTATAAG